MKTENILTIEESGENRINLVRDSLFWQAWNKSAFLFVTHIKKYQVQKRFVKKVSQEVAWIGFPRTELVKVEQLAQEKGWTFEEKSADHIIIDGLPSANGYEKWWASIVKPVTVVANTNTERRHDKARRSDGAGAGDAEKSFYCPYHPHYLISIILSSSIKNFCNTFPFETVAKL